MHTHSSDMVSSVSMTTETHDLLKVLIIMPYVEIIGNLRIW